MAWGKHIVFRDSYQLLSGSLEHLVENLKAYDPRLFKRMADAFHIQPEDLQDHPLLKKGVFPYDWFDGLDKLAEPALPPLAAFFSQLRQEQCSVENYAHAQNIWTRMRCHSFEEYMLTYLKTDVL